MNGLDMYYELHGAGAGQPLVLLHGALNTIDTSFGELLPILAATRLVIAIEQQGHGHTADIARPLSYEHMADDTAELLRQLRIGQADILGYSMGGGIALQLAIRHRARVRRLIVVAAIHDADGLYPEVAATIRGLAPEHFAGSAHERAYAATAPDPTNWGALIEKVKQLDLTFTSWPQDDLRSIQAPALVVVADSDVVRPEHAVEMFRLLGGGVAGDFHGLPRSQLAILPGTTHTSLVAPAQMLASIALRFLEAPASDAAGAPSTAGTRRHAPWTVAPGA